MNRALLVWREVAMTRGTDTAGKISFWRCRSLSGLTHYYNLGGTCYRDILHVFVCNTSSHPRVCPHSLPALSVQGPIATEPDSWPELGYCTLMNIINKQQVVQVFMGEKLLQSNQPGGVLCWNKHKSILTHFLAAWKKTHKVVFFPLTASHRNPSIKDLKWHV